MVEEFGALIAVHSDNRVVLVLFSVNAAWLTDGKLGDFLFNLSRFLLANLLDVHKQRVAFLVVIFLSAGLAAVARERAQAH